MNNIIYVVEDEENIRELICVALKSAGFQATAFESSKSFYKAFEAQKPNLVLLDIMLPEESGYQIITKIKSQQNNKCVPVIFLTAKSSEIEKVMGLDMGANDYIVKPFGVLELISRVKAVLRTYKLLQSGKESFEKIVYKDLFIDTAEKSVFKNNKKIELTFKEYELLLYFYRNQKISLSREKLLSKVWGYDYQGETRTVDAHIRSLRRKIGDESENPKYIATVRGHGYMFLS